MSLTFGFDLIYIAQAAYLGVVMSGFIILSKSTNPVVVELRPPPGKGVVVVPSVRGFVVPTVCGSVVSGCSVVVVTHGGR